LKEKPLLPGDYIASCEEYLPGKGTFVESGRIFSSVKGMKMVDQEEMLVEVIPTGSYCEDVQKNDTVLGRVSKFSKNHVFIDIYYKKKKPRQKFRPIFKSKRARIHLSMISRKHINNIENEMSENDIVKGLVIQVEPSIMVSTAQEDMGIMKSVCHSCGNTFQRRGRLLACIKCKFEIRKKVSSDYGEMTALIE